jgi:transcriptional regulator with XRE-family HTH domain
MKKEELQKIIGNRIKLLRESKGISQQVLAAMCNFEKGNMSRIEARRANPTLTTLYKISQSLGIKVTDIVDFE